MENKQQLFVPEWLKLPRETRILLADKFGLTRDVCTEVDGGVVKCDGFSNKMLANLTADIMAEYLGSDSNDFYELFTKTIEKITYVEPIVEPVVTIAAVNTVDNVINETLIKKDEEIVKEIEKAVPADEKEVIKEAEKPVNNKK